MWPHHDNINKIKFLKYSFFITEINSYNKTLIDGINSVYIFLHKKSRGVGVLFHRFNLELPIYFSINFVPDAVPLIVVSFLFVLNFIFLEFMWFIY